jgi:hypothetical protein
MNKGSCAQVLETLIQWGETGRIPLVQLRPRAFDDKTVFDGDFDFLIDEHRFGDILEAVFQVCRDAGVSFIVRQHATFKRQIELLDARSRHATLELWPHAEFRTRPSHGRLTRAALAYGAYASVPAEKRPSVLAALFILHLQHKQKDPGAGLARARLAHFLGQPGLPAELREALAGLETGGVNPAQAHARALGHLRSLGIPLESPVQVLAARFGRALRNAFKWPAPRTNALVGPDGSGKTAIMDAIQQSPLGKRMRFKRFKRVFRRPLLHLRKSEPRNVRDEKMLWLVLPVSWVFFSAARWLWGWARPVLMDRYFYDYFVRDVRNPGRPLRRIGAYDLCSALTPRPQRLIVATCPTEVIRTRKTEMTAVSIDLLYKVYVDQVARSGIPETLFCHTGIALQTSCRQVVAFLERRLTEA